MESKRDHKIYKYTNVVNNKVYVGRTCQTLEERANGDGSGYKHCTYFYNAIQKYGWKSFKGEVLEENLSDTEAAECEEYYIKKFDSAKRDKGYNICDKSYRTYKDETRKKMCIAQTGKKRSSESREKMSKKRKGRKMPESLKKKLLAANTGRKCTPETIEKIRKANLGRRPSKEARKKMSESKKGKYSGRNHPNWGKPLSEKQKEILRSYHAGIPLSPEVKKKMSESLRGKGTVKVQCTETKVVYDSIKEASELTGIKRTNISYALRSGGATGGYHWMYLSDNPVRGRERSFYTSIRCLETGEKYYSISYASKCTGINRKCISSAVHHANRTAGGYHWERVSDDIKRVHLKGKRIVCVETGIIYSSIIEAAEALGTDRRNISDALRKRKGRVTARGYHWHYVKD